VREGSGYCIRAPHVAGESAADALVVAMAVVVMLVGAVGCHDSIAHPSAGSKHFVGEYRPTLTRPLPEPFAGHDMVRVLLVGSDTRPHDVGRADTIMVLFVNPRLPRAALISVPRDLRVQIPHHGLDKINHSYAFGGVELTRRTVEELFETDIPYYVHCDFDTFVKAVDMLGGVEVEVPDVEGKGRGMNYDDNWGNLHIHLTPGLHHLNGYEAMGFVRYRHGDSDFNRTKRQQEFIRALLAQKLRVANLPSLLRAGSYVLRKLDTNLSWQEAVDFLRVAKALSPGDLLTETVPIGDMRIGGIYYAGLREDAFRELMAGVRAHLSGAENPRLAVTVLNGAGVAGVARRVATSLENKGWTVAQTGNAEDYGHEKSRIEYPAGGREGAERLAEDLGITDAEMVENDGGLEGLRVTIGRDYASDNDLSRSDAASCNPGREHTR
jgi:LCP family protein required for cell wall assembly